MSAARVLAAVMRLHAQHGRVTVPALAAEVGLAKGGMHRNHLVPLRDAGLIAWEPGTSGTLRPLVTPVVDLADVLDDMPNPGDVRDLLAYWDDQANEGADTGPSATGGRS